jgi:hypothetical protein
MPKTERIGPGECLSPSQSRRVTEAIAVLPGKHPPIEAGINLDGHAWVIDVAALTTSSR